MTTFNNHSRGTENEVRGRAAADSPAMEIGRPNCSYKGGDPGFVRVLDERTVAFPSWDGNGP